MGSLSSRPKVPSTPQIVYVPQSITTPLPANPSSSPAQSIAPNSDNTSAPSATETARADDLLRRPRGRAGTIQTSFRGLLSAPSFGQKKTLLGE